VTGLERQDIDLFSSMNSAIIVILK